MILSMTPQIVLALSAMFLPPSDGTVPPIAMPLATREDYEEVRRVEQREERRETVRKQLRRLERIAPKTDMRDLDEQVAQFHLEIAQKRRELEQLMARIQRELDELNELNWRLESVDRLPIPETERCRLREKINRDFQQRQPRK